MSAYVIYSLLHSPATITLIAGSCAIIAWRARAGLRNSRNWLIAAVALTTAGLVIGCYNAPRAQETLVRRLDGREGRLVRLEQLDGGLALTVALGDIELRQPLRHAADTFNYRPSSPISRREALERFGEELNDTAVTVTLECSRKCYLHSRHADTEITGDAVFVKDGTPLSTNELFKLLWQGAERDGLVCGKRTTAVIPCPTPQSSDQTPLEDELRELTRTLMELKKTAGTPPVAVPGARQ